MNTMNVADVLNDDRQLRALIGLGRDQFETLLKEFSSCLNENQPKNRKKNSKSPVKGNPVADANQHSDRPIINCSLSCST